MKVDTYSAFSELVHRMQLSKEEDNYNFDNALRTLQGLLSEDEIKFFYAKNIFNKENQTELILFLDSSVLTVKADKERTKVTSMNLSDVETIEFEFVELGTRTAHMKVIFSNSQYIQFNSLEDSNEHWNWKYVEQIKEIFNYLK
jgi:Protein of unknown function (DUF3908)